MQVRSEFIAVTKGLSNPKQTVISKHRKHRPIFLAQIPGVGNVQKNNNSTQKNKNKQQLFNDQETF